MLGHLIELVVPATRRSPRDRGISIPDCASSELRKIVSGYMYRDDPREAR
jgi:hypothetical protein